MKFLNLIKKLQKGGFNIMLILVGLAFIIFSLLPILFPGSWSTDSSPWMTGVFIAVGAVMAFFGFRGISKVAKTSLEEENYFDKVEKKNLDPEVVRSIAESESPVNDYYFHYCGNLNQSYIMETTDRQPVYEINCDKVGLLSDFIFTFKNHLTGKEFTSKISHTITTEYGSDSFSLVDKSYFKIDGQNIWDYIGEMGYSTEPYMDPVVFSFKIRHLGVEVADLKAAGTNILPEFENTTGLRVVPMSSGLYRVTCREEDVEAVALIAFAVSRVQII